MLVIVIIIVVLLMALETNLKCEDIKMNKNVNINKVKRTGCSRPFHKFQLLSYVFYVINIALFYTWVVISFDFSLQVSIIHSNTIVDFNPTIHNFGVLNLNIHVKSNNNQPYRPVCGSRNWVTNKWSKFHAWSRP